MRSIQFPRHIFPILSTLLITFFIVACGSSNSNSGSGGSTPAATSQTGSTPTQASGGYGKNYASPTTTAPSTSAASVHTATATVNGKSMTILTNAQGMTLYYLTADTKTTSACTSGCSGTWPALIAQGSTAPTGVGTLPGKLSTQASGNGNQVQYNSHFLYTYSGDTAAGQTNGEGIAGKWFVATTTLM